jgi:hypothetical protein
MGSLTHGIITCRTESAVIRLIRLVEGSASRLIVAADSPAR